MTNGWIYVSILLCIFNFGILLIVIMNTKLKYFLLLLIIVMGVSDRLTAQSGTYDQEIFMKGLSRSQTAIVSEGKIYKLGFGRSDEMLRPIVRVYSEKDYKMIKEYPIDILMPEGVKLKSIQAVNRGELFLSADGSFYVVYDIGSAEFISEASGNRAASGQTSFSYTLVNRTGDMAKHSFLVCQKLDKSFKPVGAPKSLMDSSIPGKKYTTRILSNEDNSSYIVFQSQELFLDALTYATGEQKVMLYDKSFNLIKTFDLKDYKKYKKTTVRALAFSGQTVSLMINNCIDCSRGSAAIENEFMWLNINTNTGLSTSALDNRFFSTNRLKVKYLKFLPGQENRYCIAMINNQTLGVKNPNSNSFHLLEFKEGKIESVQSWEVDVNSFEDAGRKNTLCFEDIFGQGWLDILPNQNRDGYYLVATRDFRFCACDTKGQKKWQYFFAMSLDKTGKLGDGQYFPILKTKDWTEGENAKVYFGVSGETLEVLGNFHQEYYEDQTPVKVITSGPTPALLKISPSMGVKFKTL